MIKDHAVRQNVGKEVLITNVGENQYLHDLAKAHSIWLERYRTWAWLTPESKLAIKLVYERHFS